MGQTLRKFNFGVKHDRETERSHGPFFIYTGRAAKISSETLIASFKLLKFRFEMGTRPTENYYEIREKGSLPILPYHLSSPDEVVGQYRIDRYITSTPVLVQCEVNRTRTFFTLWKGSFHFFLGRARANVFSSLKRRRIFIMAISLCDRDRFFFSPVFHDRHKSMKFTWWRWKVLSQITEYMPDRLLAGAGHPCRSRMDELVGWTLKFSFEILCQLREEIPGLNQVHVLRIQGTFHFRVFILLFYLAFRCSHLGSFDSKINSTFSPIHKASWMEREMEKEPEDISIFDLISRNIIFNHQFGGNIFLFGTGKLFFNEIARY